MATRPAAPDLVAELTPRFTGELVDATKPAFDDARRVHNGLIDKCPALVARCRTSDEVAAVIRAARERDLEIAVRGGGHGVAGRATCDAGVVIDLSLMREVEVDPKKRTATAEGGATWGDFNTATQAHALASTGGIISTTGVGGLTLGGGLGWLLGRCGLSVDNLLSARMVTAEGEEITTSAESHPDLFWAIRGAGANFGVATSLRFQLHQIGPTITGGLIAWPFDKAREVLRFYRDICEDVPDDFTVYGGLVHAPDGSGVKLAAILVCHCGELKDGEAAVRPIKQFGKPAMDAIGPMEYTALNSMLDGGYPRGALNYWKSNYAAELSDEMIDAMIDAFAKTTLPMSQVVLEHIHGAAARIDRQATAFPHRGVGFNMLVLSQWMDPAQTEQGMTWARESFRTLQRFGSEGSYVNYLGHDEPEKLVAASYGPNYDRLREIKRQYDPENVFHLNQNIRP